MPLTTPISDTPRQLLLVKYGVNPAISKVLTTAASAVTDDMFDHRLRQLIVDMFHTMYRADGIGLAATQIGLSLRVAVIDISSGRRPEAKIVLVNPEIIDMHGCQTDMEGCLSLPGISEPVERANFCRVEAQNERGDHYQATGEGLLARALQHEVDHLDGKIYLDHVSRLRRRLIKDRIKRLRHQGKW